MGYVKEKEMKKNILNSKGFTLVELIATIVILALVMSIGSYTVVTLINDSKEKDYNLFISQVNDAAETFYNECKYMDVGLAICDSNTVTLGELVNSGFLKGNSTDSNGYSTVMNPRDKENISSCLVTVTYNDGIKVTPAGGGGSCPEEY